MASSPTEPALSGSGGGKGRFHHPAVPIVLAAVLIDTIGFGSVAAIIGPLAMTQALAFGAERGEPGGSFLLASGLAFLALLIAVFLVVPRLRSTG